MHQQGMTKVSANIYINNFKLMMKGRGYKRTLNLYAVEYYLENISKDYGSSGLKSAVQSVELHINYFGNFSKGKMPGLKNLLNHYRKISGSGEWVASGSIYPDEIEDSKIFTEGAKKQRWVNAYERNADARKECIKKYNYICAVCNFDFRVRFGEIGKEFIHVHHLIELSAVAKEYQIDPIKDLRPVCPNCHAMLHRKRPAFTIEELKKIIELQKGETA